MLASVCSGLFESDLQLDSKNGSFQNPSVEYLHAGTTTMEGDRPACPGSTVGWPSCSNQPAHPLAPLSTFIKRGHSTTVGTAACKLLSQTLSPPCNFTLAKQHIQQLCLIEYICAAPQSPVPKRVIRAAHSKTQKI